MIETVTPEMAARWMRHSHQRRIDLLKVRMMLDDIPDRWDPAKQKDTPVLISRSRNTCLNGHHRLLMVLFLTRPIELWVEYQK